jgi:hypothetical protein
MSPAPIDSSIELLLPVSSDGIFSDRMAMLPTDKPVLIVSGPFSQHDVDQYTWCFKSPHIGSWIHGDAASTSTVTKSSIAPTDERLDVPQIRIGPGLSKDLTWNNKRRCILVVQGRTGVHRVKVMVANSREQAATIMMHEALNGYSTVFSASYEGRALHDLPVGEKLKFRAFSGSDWPGYEEGVTVVNMVCHPPLKHDDWKKRF